MQACTAHRLDNTFGRGAIDNPWSGMTWHLVGLLLCPALSRQRSESVSARSEMERALV